MRLSAGSNLRPEEAQLWAANSHPRESLLSAHVKKNQHSDSHVNDNSWLFLITVLAGHIIQGHIDNFS